MRDVAGRPLPIGGHCMVRFDSHRAVLYGGTRGEEILDSLYVVDLEIRVGEEPGGTCFDMFSCNCAVLLLTGP